MKTCRGAAAWWRSGVAISLVTLSPLIACGGENPTAPSDEGEPGGPGSPESSGIPATDLGGPPGSEMTVTKGMNESAEIVGFSYSAADTWDHAVYFDGGTWIDLGRGYAFDISDGGLIVGYRLTGPSAGIGSLNGSWATVWERQGGSWVETTLPADPALAGNDRFGVNQYAYGVNPRGDLVAGWGEPPGTGTTRALLWTRSGGGWSATVLPLDGHEGGQANDVGDDGTVLGLVYSSDIQYAAVWRDSGGWSLTVLGQLPGGRRAKAADINSAGTIVGAARDPDDRSRAVIWPRSGDGWGAPIVIGDPSWTDAGAGAIDDGGRVVGSAIPPQWHSYREVGFLWDPVTGRTTPLTTTGDTFATAINNRGQIAGSGFDYARAVMWTVP